MPLVIYSLLRLAILGACAGLLAWAGLRDWLLLLVAVVLAAMVSYVAFPRQREASALYLAGLSARREAGINSPGDDDADEDAEVDRQRGQ